jgi:hypothetical protein
MASSSATPTPRQATVPPELRKTDFKFATETKLGSHDAVVGASPTMLRGPDLLGTLPGWDSRHLGLKTGPSAGMAHSMLSGRPANRTRPVGFAFLDNHWREIGHYGTMAARIADGLLGQTP